MKEETLDGGVREKVANAGPAPFGLGKSDGEVLTLRFGESDFCYSVPSSVEVVHRSILSRNA